MFHISPSFAYLAFALWTALVWLGVYYLLIRSREVQLWMSGWGLIGGPFINEFVYVTDFWQPAGAIPFFPIESALFGAGFLGILSAVTLELSGGGYYPEMDQSVRRSAKIWTLITTVLVALGAYIAGFNSVASTAVGLGAGAGMILLSRRDLWPLLIKGVVASLIASLATIVVFVFLIAGNAHDLGRELSTFYAKHGAGGTAILLFFWTVAFGAFFGPFYAWAKNLRQIRV